MARVNLATARKPAVTPPRINEPGATQTFDPAYELRRLASTALLGERSFYVNGADIEARMVELAQAVNPLAVAGIAIEARQVLGLRHAPLLLLREVLAKESAQRAPTGTFRAAAAQILRTPRDAMDLVALYWKGKPAGFTGKLPSQLQRAVRDGFGRWSRYQIAKYATLTNVQVRLRDLVRLAHPKGDDALLRALVKDELRAPETWESLLPRATTVDQKREVWEGLLRGEKLPALAMVRNLRNMEEVGVDRELVRAGLARLKATDVWPWQALAAMREAGGYAHDLEVLIQRSAGAMPKIPRRTAVLVDVSPSMDYALSEKGTMKRWDAAFGLAVLLREMCEDARFAGFAHRAAWVHAAPRGTMLAAAIKASVPSNGTYLGAAISWIFAEGGFDQLIILTDEESQDRATIPMDGVPVFLVNLAPGSRGLTVQGAVNRITGWSGGVVRFIAEQLGADAQKVPAAEEVED